jgi:hypothetical protein
MNATGEKQQADYLIILTLFSENVGGDVYWLADTRAMGAWPFQRSVLQYNFISTLFRPAEAPTLPRVQSLN